MRLLRTGTIITLIGLAAFFCTSANAAGSKKHSVTYGSCYCSFGYPDLACIPVVSCYDEGGRCKKPCPRQP